MHDVGTAAEKVIFHLTRQVLARPLVGQVEAVFVDQHGLLFHPVSPRLFADLLPKALAQWSRVGWEIQPFSFDTQFDAFNNACHKCVYFRNFQFEKLKGL